MENSKSPITISEIPPKKESSGLSLFNRLGERSVSQNSESSLISQKSSSSKSLKQTFIENWITVTTASQSKATMANNTEHKLPPWATIDNNMNHDHDVSFASAPIASQQHEIANDICESNSECSLPAIDDKLDNFKPVAKMILNEDEYSVMAKDFGSILSEEDLYATPRPDLSSKSNSVERLLSYQDHHTEVAVPSISQAHNNLDTQAVAPCDHRDSSQVAIPYNHDSSSQATIPYNHDTDSQATVPYNHDSSSQATIPYNHDTDSQATAPYNHDTDSQATIPYNPDHSSQGTIPYDYHDGSQETVPCDANTDSQSEDHYTANDSILVFYNEQQSDIPNTTEEPLGDIEEDLPPIASPELDSIPGSPIVDYEELEELAKIADELSSKDKRQHDLIDTIEISPQHSAKIQKLNVPSSQKRHTDSNSLESPEVVKLVRPEKKQIRSSTLKQPMTIENYFLFSSETNRQREEDIGRDSVAPSSYSGKIDNVKKDDKLPTEPIGKRKRPSLGLSKRIPK